MTARPKPIFAWVARGLAAASLLSLVPLGAYAQEAGGAPSSPGMQTGISIRANVDLVYLPSLGDEVKLSQTSFSAGAMGDIATPANVFDILNRAALAGLTEALAQGARAGRITVVASGCEVGVAGDALKAAAPIGIFVNTTDMEMGRDGKPVFTTRVRFIPDTETAPQTRAPATPDMAPRSFDTIPWGWDGRK